VRRTKNGLYDRLFPTLLIIQSLAFWLLDALCLLFPKERRPTAKKQVLVIRLDAIGDFILWLDAAKELRSLYPADRYEITLVGNRLWAPIAEQLPHFDTVLSLDPRRFTLDPGYRISTIRRLRRTGCSVAVHPTYSRDFLTGDALVRASGAPERLGSEGRLSITLRPWQKRISDRWYTRLVPATSGLLMEILRNAEFMRGIGAVNYKACISQLPQDLPPPRNFGRRDYYVLFPGAGQPFRQWPLPRFADIAQRIHRATNWTGVICGGPADVEEAKILERMLRVPCEDWTGKTTLRELIAVIRDAHIVVGNETGAIHIAAAVSTPSVCILGGGHFGRFVPYKTECETARPLPFVVYSAVDCFQCDWRCRYAIRKREAARCIENVSCDMVWDAVRPLLSTTPMQASDPQTPDTPGNDE
jgi:ADP-heptose:LPS heptosyltransferase